ncbi:MAG: 3-ketoacyl-ACP reductase [Cereibacter sphaeroides]|uniref:3-ketoacyl-ACP reductase n=1 Tax=Cereibacter sphaeroides TaxID=1063 RepID=A0A2W5S8M6_CERSP|nr:MAG: 3-ketoacyl-ACP reductase [Cereibacter sphaeroides]
MEQSTTFQSGAAVGNGQSLGVALVTGGRRGIGRAICGQLAGKGFDVAFIDHIDDEGIQETTRLIESFGRKSLFFRSDLALLDQHEKLVSDTIQALGQITCLVNNAGVQVSVRGDLLFTDAAEFDRLMSINLRGTFFLTQAVAKAMIADRDPAANRSIITVTSANAHLVSPEKGAYCVSKAGLSMAMQNYALRLAGDGIRVFEIRPGLIETDMTADVREHYTPAIENGVICAMRRWGTPDDIAKAIGTLAAGDLPFSTGDIYNIGGGMQIPRL